MAPPSRNDPYTGFNFRVEIDGINVAAFTEVSGLASETDVIDYREGGDSIVRLLPGITTYRPIVLRRGITNDRSLWLWRKAVVDGQIDRRHGRIVLLDADGTEVARWTFRNGWPAKWEGPALNAQASDVAIESIEIVHEGLDWES
jgi:phage tail-like protein